MRDQTYYVYIVSTLSRTLYPGVTNDLQRRIFEHNERRPGSFTARYNVNRLVYYEELRNINEAITREKELKRLTRRRKIELIDSINPDWRDLSLDWEQPDAESGIPRAAATRGNDTGVKAHTMSAYIKRLNPTVYSLR